MTEWAATVYKPCAKRCGDCRQCREFEEIINQIDLNRRSPFDRQRNIDKERSKDA